MKTLQALIDLLKSKAKQTSEDNDLIEFEKGKYFFGVVKNGKELEGITISRKLDAKYANRAGFKIIDTIDNYSEKNEARIIRYLQD
jgi:anaerobic ribonucleoside-triphosphate reductase